MQEALRLIDINAAIIAMLFILLDVISGIIKGAATHNLSSQKMREGFWHKMAFLLMIFLGILIDYAAETHLDLGYSAPIFEVICTYIIAMEIFSILENIKEINPELGESGIMKLFPNKQEAVKDDTDEHSEGE